MWKVSLLFLITFSSLSYSFSLSSLTSSLTNTLTSGISHAFDNVFSNLHKIDLTKFLGKGSKTLNSSELITEQGYPAEEHTCTTSDGYNLQLFRIPGKGPIVFLFHGLFYSSDDFIAIGKNSLPYKLHRNGWDVWMGNARGNVYSRKHDTLNPDDCSFWDFSWHEIGVYDLPAMIDYILEKTGETKLTYVAHSQASTAAFVLLSEIPEYNDKFAGIISQSTAVLMSNIPSPVFQGLAKKRHELELAGKVLGMCEIVPRRPPITYVTGVCGSTSFLSTLCLTPLFTIFGFDYDLIDFDYTATQFAHFPSGSSTLQLYHYLQNIDEKAFLKYDYGPTKNVQRYGSKDASAYVIENVKAKVAFMYGKNDWFSSYEDLKTLSDQLPNVVEMYEVPFEKFNHVDFLWAKNADVLVYEKVIELIKTFNENL